MWFSAEFLREDWMSSNMTGKSILITHTKKIQSSFLLGRKSFNSLAYQNKGIAYMKLCLWDKGYEFWCKFLSDMKLRRCVFSSLQIKNTCLNINMEIIMFNVVILSGSWRNISIFQWVVFLFSRENLKFFFAFLISTHFTFAQNRNRGGWSVLKFLKYFNFLGGQSKCFFLLGLKTKQDRSSNVERGF